MFFNNNHVDTKEFRTKAANLWQVSKRGTSVTWAKGEERPSSLLLNRDSSMLQNLGEIFIERRWETRVDILTESKASRVYSRAETNMFAHCNWQNQIDNLKFKV